MGVRSAFGPPGYERAVTACNEELFRHLLQIEWLRAEQAQRHLFLVIVTIRGVRPPLASALSGRIFSSLSVGLRAEDVLGWFRDQRNPAAILTEGAPVPAPDTARCIAARLDGLIRSAISRDAARGLRLRVRQFPAT